jgi:hypothetical protein
MRASEPAMYFILHCFSPPDCDNAMLTHRSDDPRRVWCSGARFAVPPPQPVRAEVKPDYEGNMAEFWDNPVPLMTRRLHTALLNAGVANLDVYPAEIFDPHTKTTHRDYLAVNIIGAVAAADLKASSFDSSLSERMISMDFDSIVMNQAAIRGAMLFRLAQSVNAIVVHDRVRRCLLESGINTLTFVPPEDWAG